MNDAQHPINALPQGYRLQEYKLVRVLGKPGGFGITYLGHDHNLDKAVAIKEYLPSNIATRTAGNSVAPRPEHTAPVAQEHRKSRDKVLWAVMGMLALLAVTVVVIYDYVEKQQREQRERNIFIAAMGREPSLHGVESNGATDLHWASYLNLPTLTLYLLNKGADVNAKNKSGWTP